MIFYSDIARDLTADTYRNLTTMVVYKGQQPSVEEFITKVNDGTYDWNGNFLLRSYKNVNLIVKKAGKVYKIEKENSPAPTTIVNVTSGTAEWAVLFDKTMVKTNTTDTNKLLEFNSTTMNFLRNITQDDLFMIVPVSDKTGPGVLRFDSIKDNNDIIIEKFTLNFS